MDEHILIVTGTLAGFGGLSIWIRVVMSAQAHNFAAVVVDQKEALNKLADAIEKLRDTLGGLDRKAHDDLVKRVDSIQMRQVQIGTELESLRHMRRDVDGG
jgi:hypothetical protein